MGYQFPVRKKRNKYNAERIERAYERGPCGSKLEGAVFQRLLLLERAGNIRDIRQQVSVHLSCGIMWKVDFSYFDKEKKRTIYAEAKGVETERYRLCLKLWRGGHGPGPLEVWKGHFSDPRVVEIVIPRKVSV